MCVNTVLNIKFCCCTYLEFVTLTITRVFLVSKEKPAVSHRFLIALMGNSQQSLLVASCCTRVAPYDFVPPDHNCMRLTLYLHPKYLLVRGIKAALGVCYAFLSYRVQVGGRWLFVAIYIITGLGHFDNPVISWPIPEMRVAPSVRKLSGWLLY